MEWEHLEPLTNKNICVQKSSAINEENNTNKEKKLQIIINSLKRENIRLCRTVNDLKFRLSIRKQVSRKKKQVKRTTKKMSHKLIDEQNLHPVARAMIDLQLHTPNAPYTDEERAFSEQFFYYSAAALRRLRKAGCNFPAEQTIRR